MILAARPDHRPAGSAHGGHGGIEIVGPPTQLVDQFELHVAAVRSRRRQRDRTRLTSVIHALREPSRDELGTDAHGQPIVDGGVEIGYHITDLAYGPGRIADTGLDLFSAGADDDAGRAVGVPHESWAEFG